MKKATAIRNATLVAALAAIAATAWGMGDTLSDSVWVPAPKVTGEPATPAPEGSITEGETVVVDPAQQSERVMPLEAAAIPAPQAAAPTQPAATMQPPITVEQRRLTTDERIQAQLMDVLAQSSVSGKIGVESRDAVVTLSGWTTTSGQAQRVARYAWAIEGVKDVQNEIRARVGPST